MVRSNAVIRIRNSDGLKPYYEYDQLTKNIHQYNVLIAGLTGQFKDDLAADRITSTEVSIFNYPNLEYLEAEGQESRLFVIKLSVSINCVNYNIF